MDCCTSPSSPGNDEEFTPAVAARTLRRWRLRGAVAHERALVDAVVATRIDGAHVLELGGGIGQLQVLLLRAGAARATNVELGRAYEQAAARLLADERLADRVERRLGDATRADLDVPAADVAVCHRVLCCTADWRGMVDTLLRARPRVVAVTLPRDGRLAGLLVTAANVVHRLLGRAFRVRHHPCDAVLARLHADGLAVVHDDVRAFWRTVVLTRAA